MASTTKEIVWLCWLLADIGVFLSHPTPMYCDNKSAIQVTTRILNTDMTSILPLPFVLVTIKT